MKFYCILFSVIAHFVCSAQKNDYVWITGGNSINRFNDGYQWGTMIADFSNDPVEFRYDSLITMDMGFTNASLSDKDGLLLMYSNGMHVHNGKHRTLPGLDTISYSNYWERFNLKKYLPDGSDWKAGFPGRQWVLMLPDPGSDDHYIFHPYRHFPPGASSSVQTGLLATKVEINSRTP